MPSPTIAPDVVIVGGGIAGASLATVLARAGRGVVVLEATECFEDRVRGESMMPWGVAEAREIGVADLLVDAGAHTASTWHRYSEGQTEPRVVPVGMLVPGVAGTLNLEHRVACQALLDGAVDAGAVVERGVRAVVVVGGAPPRVEYRHRGERRACRPNVVVGADGRASSVRRSIGVTLERQAATGFVAGMLLDGVTGPDDHDVVFEHENGMALVLAQGSGSARAYHCVPVAERTRFAGANGPQRFLDDARTASSPITERLADARPAGPCATFAGIDTWTDTPFTHGVVLIGDAAGQNDPTAGCGLSIAMRDVRLVRDLLLAGATSIETFVPYGIERSERMRRLRLVADLIVAASVESAPNRPARRKRFAAALEAMDPQVFPLILAMFTGPETASGDAFTPAVIDWIRAA